MGALRPTLAPLLVLEIPWKSITRRRTSTRRNRESLTSTREDCRTDLLQGLNRRMNLSGHGLTPNSAGCMSVETDFLLPIVWCFQFYRFFRRGPDVGGNSTAISPRQLRGRHQDGQE